MAASIEHFQAFEDTSPALMSRVTGNAGAAITQASLTSITLDVYSEHDGSAVAEDVDVTISSTVFDTLQTDARWTKDSTGYNFRYDCPQTYLPSPGLYRYEFTFDPASGGDFCVVFIGNVLAKRSS